MIPRFRANLEPLLAQIEGSSSELIRLWLLDNSIVCCALSDALLRLLWVIENKNVLVFLGRSLNIGCRPQAQYAV